jgi:hypothetical protein
MQKTLNFRTFLGYGAVVLAGGVMLATAVAGDAHASGPRGDMMDRAGFSELDADGNGELSREELQNRAAARFAAVDADGDGKLTVEEMIAAGNTRASERAARMVERFDTDGDGALSQDELRAGREDRAQERRGNRFERLDADGSGGLSQAEFEAGMERRGHHGARGDGRGDN